MDLALRPHTLAAIMAISLLGALLPGGQASAAPVAQHEVTEPMTGAVVPDELALEPAALTVDAGDGQGAAIQAPDATPGRARRAERASGPTPLTKLESQNSAAKQPNPSPEPGFAAEIRSTVKESVRPLRDQLVESGALDAWNDLKADLGLSKNKWGDEGAADVNTTQPGRPDASNSASWQDPAHRPKTAAQAEIDREMASLMMDKLIEEVKPWVFSLVGLYLLGYLIKAGYDYAQRKSIRRRERETAMALRRSARRVRSTKPDS